jgi:molybdenum cofactor cytidylyltransferase
MLSSLQTAVRHLPSYIDAVLVTLVDQPLVEPETIDHLLAAYWQGHGELIAPSFAGRRGNPVLIGRPHFDELLRLPVGKAPRDLLRRHEVYLVPAQSAAVLDDIDTMDDYRRLHR